MMDLKIGDIICLKMYPEMKYRVISSLKYGHFSKDNSPYYEADGLNGPTKGSNRYFIREQDMEICILLTPEEKILFELSQ